MTETASHRVPGRVLKALLGSSAMLLCVATTALAQTVQNPAGSPAMAAGFANPPQSARPRVWWHWMNGNITKDGIRKDIEWMSRVGIGGLQNFDAALQTPQIVDKRLVYMTPEWKDAFRYAAQQADEKGLEMTVAASPGWSETGGPWVTPQDGMKKLVWSETVVEGGRPLTTPLASPPTATGPFQDISRGSGLAAETGKPDPTYYADAVVLAFPLAAGGGGALKPRLTTVGGVAVNGDLLADGRYAQGLEIPRGSREAPGFVVADFGAPRLVRSVSISVAKAAALFQPPNLVPRLEVEEAGGWRKIADLALDSGVPLTVAFAPVTAQRFRVVFAPAPPPSGPGLGSVPGAVVRPLFASQESPTLTLAELSFSDEERIDLYEVKAAFGILDDYYKPTTTATPDAAGVAPAQVINLTSKMSADGRLDWTPPAGRWKVLRMGYSLVGTTNHPAPVEATGLEVDKFDGAAVKRYIDRYVDNLTGATGGDMIGRRGLQAILTDSIEVGASNWTPRLIEDFRRLRGYDPTPWLPTLTGVVVGSRAQSDRFLFDFRTTLSDLMSSEHYGQVAATAHARGLKVYGEALEGGRPTLGDDMAMRRHADIPMAALWTYDPANGPRTPLLGDMKGAASVAHIYGQNIAAAESLTAAFSPWAFAPKDLKPTMDLEFAYGINRPVIHTSVHQPVDDKQPGLSLGPFGQYFNRHETWAEMAKPWVDYMSRSAFMLQQGRYAADVAYFYGEDAPLTVLYADGPPKDVPVRYPFDFVNRDVVLQELSVDGGTLVAKGGARYRALYLGGTTAHMTLPVLRKVAALAEAGATIVGNAPVGSPALSDDAAQFRALTSRLWGGGAVTTVGRGRVVAGASAEQALASAGLAPDFVGGTGNDQDILFLHRQTPDADIYFVTNRTAKALQTDARFRVTGKTPEIWRAETGKAMAASYRTDVAQTVVPLEMLPNDAFFVVFAKAASAPSATAPKTTWRSIATVEGPWDVAFQSGRGAPASAQMPKLASLTESADPGVRYFSGTSTYRKQITAPSGLSAGAPLMLDLGDVGDVAEVRVNGQLAGTVWKAPYRVDVGALLKPGANQVEVKVANLWVNRLIGDAQPGASKVAFTVVETYEPTAPLRPAGLIGPVSLMAP